MEIQRKKKRAIIIKSNLTDRDPWLAKVLDTVKRGGYEVVLLGWDRYGNAPETRPSEVEDNYREILLRLRAPWGIKIIPFYPIWWCFIFFWLMKTRWDIAQAINFECIIPAIVAAKLKRRPMIYQIYDIYADVMILPQWLRRIIVDIDKFYMRLANAVILANETQEREVNGIPNDNVVPIYNPPPDLFNKAKVQRNDVFTIFYAGVLYRFRRLHLDRVFQAIKDMDKVRLIIAGYGDMVEDIEEWVKQADGKAEFIGKISYDEVLERTLASDLLFALYSSDIPSVRYAPSCNKIMEAMMAHKPIIVTKDTAMADLVTEENFGFAVDPENVEEIRQAILKLKEDPELHHRLGENGRKAYEQKFNREIMEKRQLDLYEKILKERK